MEYATKWRIKTPVGANKPGEANLNRTDNTIGAGRQVIRCMLLGGASALIGVSPALATIDETPAPAAPSVETGLEEIIVTAQKRSENLQNVPLAVASFSAATLQAANVSGVADLVNVTPSLRFQYAGPSGSTFLRGVGNSQSFAGSEAEVQTYIDNVYQPSGAAAYLKFNNIERIEVDKGPQGTLFGRNATGGVIQIFTRDPTQDARLDAAIGYGKYNQLEGDVYAAGGLGEKVAADIAFHYEDRDGWGRNTFLKTDAYKAHSIGFRSKWIVTLSDATRVTLIGDYSRDRSDLGTAFALAQGPWRLSLAEPVPAIPNKFTLTEDSQSGGKVERYGGSVKVDSKVGDLSLVSISAYRYSVSQSVLDADSTPDPVVVGKENRKESQFSQEFQLLSPSSSRLKWILGTYLYYNKAKADPGELSGLIAAGFGANAIQSFSTMTTKSVAGFGQATYDITDTIHITAGLRYTHDHRSQEATSVFIYPNGPGAPPPFLGLNQNKYPTASFNALTGKLTLQKDLSDSAMVYAGYNRGYKAGTFNNSLVLSSTGPALNPEHVDAFEGGLKSELFDHKLRLNLAAFYYKYSNLQVNVFEAFRISLQNSGRSEIKGLEAEAQYKLTSSTRLSAGASLLDARYKVFTNAPLYTINPANQPNPSPQVRGYGGVIISQADASGNTMPQAPKFSSYASLNQTIEIGAGRIDLNGTVSYQSRVYFTPDNRYSQSGYPTLSATAKFTTTDNKYDFTLWGRNLTNEKTYGALTIAGYRVAGYPNEPFSFGGRVGVHF